MKKQSLDGKVELVGDSMPASKKLVIDNTLVLEKVNGLIKYFSDTKDSENNSILTNLGFLKMAAGGRLLDEFPDLRLAYEQLLDGKIPFYNEKIFLGLLYNRYFFSKNELGFTTKLGLTKKNTFNPYDYLPKIESVPATVLG